MYTGTTETLGCTGSHRYHARGTAYYPANDPIEGGFYDMHGQPLHTLQVFVDNYIHLFVICCFIMNVIFVNMLQSSLIVPSSVVE